MPLESQAQWRQVFALANRGEVPMATAREMARASAPYALLPAYAGAGPDQCEAHWHHVNLPEGQTIRTDYDCHIGADAMEKENLSMKVGWGGRVPVTLDIRTRGDMVHGVATIQFPNVETPARILVSANFREIYNALRRRGAVAGGNGQNITAINGDLKLFDPAGRLTASGAEFNLMADDWKFDIKVGGEDDVGAAPTAIAAYPAALTALALMAGLAGAKNPSRGTDVDRAYGAALAALAVMAAAAGAVAGGNTRQSSATAYAAALAALALMAGYAGSKTPAHARAYAGALTALALMAGFAGAAKANPAPHNPNGAAALIPLALMSPASAAALTPLALMAAYPAASVALSPLALMAASPVAAAALVPLAVATAYPAGAAALTPLALMVAASQTQGDTVIAGYGKYAYPTAMTALALLAAYGGSRLGASARSGAEPESFQLMLTAKKLARSEVVQNLNRVVQKSVSNPLIRSAMEMTPEQRAHFAVKAGARIYGRAMGGDAAAKQVIQKLGEQSRKGSKFADRALKLLKVGREQYYGRAKSGIDLIGECVPMPVQGSWEVVIGDQEIEALLEAATGVGAWEGVEWIVDRLKWQSMGRNPDTTMRQFLLAGRRAGAARPVLGQL